VIMPQPTIAAVIEKYAGPLSLIALAAVVAIVITHPALPSSVPSLTELEKAVLPLEGIELPIVWGTLGKQMTEAGVIDKAKFVSLYEGRGGLTEEERVLLEGNVTGTIVMTPENSGYLLNLLWALGLANKNPILEAEMMDSKYGGAGHFASTGGWTLAKGDAMQYYNKLSLIPLTKAQEDLVDRVSKNIYRPCCGNSVHFPDCNHGMAMLALLELMAAQGVTEEKMYEAALQANAYWFPGVYLTIAQYEAERGVSWSDVSPKEVLSEYSSAAGFAEIASKVKKMPQKASGAGCGA
jgi:hypothetical protein